MRTLTKNLDRAAEFAPACSQCPPVSTRSRSKRVREHMKRAPAPRRQTIRRTLAGRNWKAKSFPRSSLRPAGRRDASKTLARIEAG